MQAHTCGVSWAWIWSLRNCVLQTAFPPSELLLLGILIVRKAECRWFAGPPQSDTVSLPLLSRRPSESCSVSWSTGESCMFQITLRSLSPSVVPSSSRSKSVKIDKVQFKFGGSDHVCGFHSVQDPFFLVASFMDSALASDARPTISKAYWIGRLSSPIHPSHVCVPMCMHAQICIHTWSAASTSLNRAQLKQNISFILITTRWFLKIYQNKTSGSSVWYSREESQRI